jgi:hypothetical protein
VLSPRHPSPGEHNSYAAYYEMNSLLKVGCLLKIIFFEDICLTQANYRLSMYANNFG